MTLSISANTQVALLLTAPLIDGPTESDVSLLSPSEYRKVYLLLARFNLQPADLIQRKSGELPEDLKTLVDHSRLQSLLDRGFQLTQAVERWQSRGIWIAGHTDEEYPLRITTRLPDHAPSIIYGCGERKLLGAGGLAVVGSRAIDDWLTLYTEAVGRLAAQAETSIISGAARGIDQASMRGALDSGGSTVGIVSDSLERAVLNREHREFILNGNLTLISPYDPSAGFNIGHAMQRNKLIYALSDAALVVNSDFEKGGTWAGAIEQLNKFRLVPVYIRSKGDLGRGLEALHQHGALLWPEPKESDELLAVIEKAQPPEPQSAAEQLSLL
jgi:predicted Rossmann fold nucleotide-binding protein DprA/Smf involved in DNA uptake